MSALHTETHSHALAPFTKGEPLPYTMSDGVRVTAATARVATASPTKQSTIHLIEAIALAWVTPERPIMGARWVCGGSSIGARFFPLEMHPLAFQFEDPMDLVCGKCRDADAGVGPCVYRVWDKSGKRLLYIGSTKNWNQRRAAHRNSTWWWRLAKSVDLEHYASIEEARAAEEAAIKAELPQMNIRHKPKESA